jgi:hypothetical protein
VSICLSVYPPQNFEAYEITLLSVYLSVYPPNFLFFYGLYRVKEACEIILLCFYVSVYPHLIFETLEINLLSVCVSPLIFVRMIMRSPSSLCVPLPACFPS